MNDTTHELGELGATSPGEPRWQPLQRADLIALVAAMAVATFLVMSRTVWAPCLDDPGEMQVAAAVGGIGHPPGHAGIVTLFRAFCLLSPMPPHLTVSFVNALFALITCLILFVLMIRTGVHALFASLCTLMLLADDQFWHAAITPEPYATCFALLGGSLWCFFSWLNKRTPWRFWLAMFLLAYVMANRAPTAAFAAAFGAVLLIDARARQAWETARLRKLALLVAIGLVPVAIIVASLWLRDVPENPYNYLDRAWLSLRDYPPDNDTAGDKWSRLWWLVSARQYDYMFHPTWRTVSGQARWLLTELGLLRGPFLWPLSVAGLAIIALGAFTLF